MTDPMEKARILIVDDVPGNIKILAELLKKEYAISMTTNGQDALRIAQSNQPELILLDVVMPGMDGFTVCQLLQENPQTRHIPVIFVTGHGDVKNEEQGLAAGGVDFIVKPFSAAIVLSRVRTHIGLRQARQQIATLTLERNALQEQLQALEKRFQEASA